MLRPTLILILGALIAALSGCAGHKELKAPCRAESRMSIFSSAAIAADLGCGPLVRQDGVSVF